MTTLFADMAVWPIYVVFGGMVAAGVFGAIGVVWLGLWLARRGQRKADAVTEDVP
jgi:hypothetical protein